MTPWLFLFSKSCRYPPGLRGGGCSTFSRIWALAFPPSPHLLLSWSPPLSSGSPKISTITPAFPPNPGCPAPRPPLGPTTPVIRLNPHNDLHFSLSKRPQRAKLWAKHTQKAGWRGWAAGEGYGEESLDHFDPLRSLWGFGGEGWKLTAQPARTSWSQPASQALGSYSRMPFPLFGDGGWRLGLQDRSKPEVRCVAKGCLVPGASGSAERLTQGLRLGIHCGPDCRIVEVLSKVVLFLQVCLHKLTQKLQGISETLQVLGPPMC